MIDSSDSHAPSNTAVSFWKKTALDHIRGVASRWRQFSLAALTVFGIVWTITEAASYFLHVDLSGTAQLVTATAFSVASAGGWAIWAYLSDSPPGLEGASPSARRIAHLQRERWEPALAQQLLRDALSGMEADLDALHRKRVFVPYEKELAFDEYLDWAKLRIESLFRLVEVATQMLCVDFVSALASPYCDGKPAAIKAVVYQIRDLYAASIAFERSRLTIKPPDEAERLHELQDDWTHVVRDAVHQLYHLTNQMLTMDLDSGDVLSFTVTVGAPRGVDDFWAELGRLQS